MLDKMNRTGFKISQQFTSSHRLTFLFHHLPPPPHLACYLCSPDSTCTQSDNRTLTTILAEDIQENLLIAVGLVGYTHRQTCSYRPFSPFESISLPVWVHPQHVGTGRQSNFDDEWYPSSPGSMGTFFLWYHLCACPHITTCWSSQWNFVEPDISVQCYGNEIMIEDCYSFDHYEDVPILRLMEAFLESVPQLLLQL